MATVILCVGMCIGYYIGRVQYVLLDRRARQPAAPPVVDPQIFES